jgi:hypothetical protein
VLANAYIHGLGENEPAGRKYIGDRRSGDRRLGIGGSMFDRPSPIAKSPMYFR